MKNSHHQETYSPAEFSDGLSKYPWLEKLMHNGKMIAIAILSAVIVFIVYFQITGTSTSELDYLKAESDFLALKKAAELPDDAKRQAVYLNNLKAILTKHPDLQAKYDGAIGQLLLNLGNLSEADPFVERTLARTRSDSLSFYADFAKNSQLVVKQDYSLALSSAKELQKKMNESSKSPAQKNENAEYGNVLFEFNILRMAILSQQVGDRQNEINSWKELASSVKLNSSFSDSSIMSSFLEGKFTLDDYIKLRLQKYKP